MKIGIPKEKYADEKRVATTPEVAAQLIKLGYEVAVESGAGAAASFADSAYEAAGCSGTGSRQYHRCHRSVWRTASQ